MNLVLFVLMFKFLYINFYFSKPKRVATSKFAFIAKNNLKCTCLKNQKCTLINHQHLWHLEIELKRDIIDYCNNSFNDIYLETRLENY